VARSREAGAGGGVAEKANAPNELMANGMHFSNSYSRSESANVRIWRAMKIGNADV
jgi:hypothetical protein